MFAYGEDSRSTSEGSVDALSRTLGSSEWEAAGRRLTSVTTGLERFPAARVAATRNGRVASDITEVLVRLSLAPSPTPAW